MKKYVISMIFVFSLFGALIFAEPGQTSEATNAAKEHQRDTPKESPPSDPRSNFEALVKDNTKTKLLTWSGKIFSISDGKIVTEISSTQRDTNLSPGNYVFMLDFKEKIPDLPGNRPFTFTITENHKTTFTLTVGTLQGKAEEEDVIRTVKGEDYLNFFLPTADPKLCRGKCEKDRNCGAYTYCYDSQKRTGRCYLIRGAGTPGPAHPRTSCLSGVIQRVNTPYQVQLTTEKIKHE